MSSSSRTVLFADVCDSSRLFEERGDAAARALIRSLLGQGAAILGAHGGRIVKTIGDELMVAFRDAEAALGGAVALLRDIERRPPEPGAGLRIGLHHGEVLQEAGDLYGSTVNTAARMVAMARCGQIITSAESLAALPQGMAGTRARSLGAHHLPGLSQPLEVVEVLWLDDGKMTSLSTGAKPPGGTGAASLDLELGSLCWHMGPGSPALRLGRDAGSDVVVDADWVSRMHAVIEYRRGFFTLSDVSTNGTFVALEGGDVITLHRNELALRGRGSISLGREPARCPGPPLRFDCT